MSASPAFITRPLIEGAFGAVASSALAPGKRPRTTLSASIAFRDGKPYMAWGTPYGDQQEQWSLQLFLRHAVAGLDLQQAIERPGWHGEHFPASFWHASSGRVS